MACAVVALRRCLSPCKYAIGAARGARRGGAVEGRCYLQTIYFHVATYFFYINYLGNDAVVVFVNNFIAMHCLIRKELFRGAGSPCVIPLRSGDRCQSEACVAVIREGKIPPRGTETRVHILTFRHNASERRRNILNCSDAIIMQQEDLLNNWMTSYYLP